MNVNRNVRALSFSTIALAVVMLTGCTIGPGMTYTVNTLEALVAASPEEVTAAAKAVAEDMKLAVVSAERTSLDGKVVARTAQNQTITIDVKLKDRNVSHISIQIGTLGDQNMSMMVFERIKSQLGA